MGMLKEQIEEEIRELYVDMMFWYDFPHEEIICAISMEFDVEEWVIELIVLDLRVLEN